MFWHYSCSVQDYDSGSYFCRASNIHLQRFLTSRRATLTVLGMALHQNPDTVPLDTQTVASMCIITTLTLFPSWQPLPQWNCGLRYSQYQWGPRCCWSVKCLVTPCPPSAGSREATPSRPEARLLWGKLMCCSGVNSFSAILRCLYFSHCTHWHLTSFLYRLRNTTLYIESARSYDEGVYVCEASNTQGQSRSTAMLRVAGNFYTDTLQQNITDIKVYTTLAVFLR